jgi:hypothetical protein
MPVSEPTSAAPGVPTSWPVVALNVAHCGLLAIEKASPLPEASEALGGILGEDEGIVGGVVNLVLLAEGSFGAAAFGAIGEHAYASGERDNDNDKECKP